MLTVLFLQCGHANTIGRGRYLEMEWNQDIVAHGVALYCSTCRPWHMGQDAAGLEHSGHVSCGPHDGTVEVCTTREARETVVAQKRLHICCSDNK